MFRLLIEQMKGRKRVISTGTYGIINALPRLTNALVAVLYASVFSLAQYGEYGILSVVIGLLGLLLDLGIPQTMLRNYYDRQHDRAGAREYLISVILSAAAICALMLPFVGAALYFGWYWLHVGQLYVIQYATLVIVIAFLDRSANIFATVFRALERPRDYSLGQLAQMAGVLGGSVIFVYGMHYRVAGALLSLLAGRVAAVVVYQVLFWVHVGGYRWRVDWKTIRSCIHFGLPLVPARFAAWAREAGLRPILANITSKSSIGLFSFASSIASAPLIASSAVEFILSPYYFKRRAQGADLFTTKVKEFGRVYLAFLTPMWAGAILFCPEAIVTLLGHRFVGAVPICAAILCASFIRTQQPYLARQIIFLRRTWIVALVTVPCAALSVGLALLLTRQSGIATAGWAVFIADFALYTGFAFGIRRYEMVHHPVGMTLCLSAGLALLALWVSTQPYTVALQEIAAKTAILAVVISGCVLLWILPKWNFIRAIARR